MARSSGGELMFSRRLLLFAISTALLASVLAPGASARSIYVTNYESQNVVVLDSATNQVVGAPIDIGANTGPFTIAITPDGKTAYSVNYDAETVSAIDTATNQVVGTPIPVDSQPFGIAISPDGTRAYVSNYADDSVSVLDLQAKQALAPIPVAEHPDSVALSPDGKRLYVANYGSENIMVFDTATNQQIGGPIPASEPYGIAITPDGRWLYVADLDGFITVIDTATNQVAGTPIPTGGGTDIPAISPDGTRAYLTEDDEGKVYVVDTATRQLVGSPLQAAKGVEYLTFTPDGKRLFVGNYEDGTVVAFDTPTGQALGPPTPVGVGTGGLAAIPDQSPAASFSAKGRARPGVPYTLDGSASSDPDGTVATYAWEFGDKGTTSTAAASVKHTFKKPGKYTATLTVTDNEGCSTAFVYTGQTAYCSGSAAAAHALKVKVAYPGVKLKCPAGAKPGGCKFKLKAVSKKGKKLKALSATAKGKAKAGKSVTISLKPKKKFAKKLAKAKKVLVQEVATIGGEAQIKVRKLKVVQ
jgi:YVTN family beta-propeller protein